MIKTSTQLKAKIRNLSDGDSDKAQYFIRNFMMERFLERISLSKYRKNFIEPDYLLFLHKKNADGYEQMRIFIEPKGSHLISHDEWKENFLSQLESKAQAVTKFVDDNEYLIRGFHFFNRENRSAEFKEDIESVE